MTLQKNAKSCVFWIFKKTGSRTMVQLNFGLSLY